jgi:hypothetical protein
MVRTSRDNTASSVVIRPGQLKKALYKCSAGQNPLPTEWDQWFPGAVRLKFQDADTHLRVRHLIAYAEERVSCDELDDTRFGEAAQIYALLDALGSPALDTIIMV